MILIAKSAVVLLVESAIMASIFILLNAFKTVQLILSQIQTQEHVKVSNCKYRLS